VSCTWLCSRCFAPQAIYGHQGPAKATAGLHRRGPGRAATQYAWDYENRLTSVTLPGSGGTVTFKYDPFGRRIEKITPSVTSIYAYDGDNLIEETDSNGAVVARYTDRQNIDEPLAMLRAGATSFYEQDGLGSVTSLTNAAGAVAQTPRHEFLQKAAIEEIDGAARMFGEPGIGDAL
jgi:YD repeat-containing protein